MSLISFRNVTAPLRSKFQIGTLVILALLVAAIRYGASDRSGKSVDYPGSATADKAVDIEAHREEIVDFLDATEKQLKRKGPKPADSELQGLVDGSYERSVRRKQNEEQPSGKFEDIRKSLGLE
ncbi:MAG: hypothetical protein RL326_1704 [Pseudomonadota bacterium]|jgi:hypothetical protein